MCTVVGEDNTSPSLDWLNPAGGIQPCKKSHLGVGYLLWMVIFDLLTFLGVK